MAFEVETLSQSLFKLRASSGGHEPVSARKAPLLWEEMSDNSPPIESFRQLLEHNELWVNADIDMRDRYDYLWREIQERCSGEELQDREIATYEILAAYNYGSRLANEVLIHFTHASSDEPGEFGNWARAALRNQNLPHADMHTRAVEAIQKMKTILVGPDIHDRSLTLVVAAAMKPIFHDITQNLWEQMKVMHKDDQDIQKLDPKDDHKEAAAFLVHVLKPLIQREGHLSAELTEELVRVLAAGISVHDQLDDFQFRLSAQDKVQALGLDDAALFAHYQNGTVDQLSISGIDRLRILRQQQKKASAKPKREYDMGVYGRYGLGYDLEKVHAALISRVLSERVTFDVEGLSFDRRLQVAWESMFNLSDIWEMIIPGEYAVVRKEKVFRSTKRELFNPDGDLAVAFSPVPLDNYDLSSWCRAMYEYRMHVDVIKKSPFHDNPLFMEFIGNTILYNMFQAQQLYKKLALGEEGLREFDRIQREQAMMGARKAIRKTGISEAEEETIMDEVAGMDMNEMLQAVLGKIVYRNEKGVEYGLRLALRFKDLEEQFKDVKSNIRRKPSPGKVPSSGVAYRYSPEDMKRLDDNFEVAWRHICRALGIEDEMRQRQIFLDMEMMAKTELQEKYPMLPNPGYPVSLGKLSDAKVLHPLPPDVQERLANSPFSTATQ